MEFGTTIHYDLNTPEYMLYDDRFLLVEGTNN